MNNTSIVSSKGIFPYDLATSLDVLKETTSLPPIWAGVTASEYEVAKKCWKEGNCQNLLDYMLIYLKLDVCLLADVFQQFREKSIKFNRLEPLNFFGNPGLFFDAGIRGGMTFVNKHHVKAEEGVELMYIDVNNLYGYALSQFLPKGDFEWILDEPTLNEMMDVCKSDTDISEWEFGCVMEVDLHIPSEVHDFLDQMPLAPERKCPPGSRVEKLLMDHEDKTNYPIHC